MKLFPVCCTQCGKIFYRAKGRINESKKLGWKAFCSSGCQGLAKNKQKTFRCCNPVCGKTFKRRIKEISPSGVCFCSGSCAAIVNNSKSPKRSPQIKLCPVCGNRFFGERKYCSRLCRQKSQRISNKQITQEIKKFYRINKRIPIKTEYSHYKAARSRFGSWNKAVKTAGFEPNPVKFAKKHIAKDGHKCDSFAELIIDNWLVENGIPHQIHVRYPKTFMTSDFLIDDARIEFIGLQGGNKKYDFCLERKRAMIKKQGFKVIELFPEDLFPQNRLNGILKSLLKGHL